VLSTTIGKEDEGHPVGLKELEGFWRAWYWFGAAEKDTVYAKSRSA